MIILRRASLRLALGVTTWLALGGPLVWGAPPLPSQYTILDAPGSVYGTNAFGNNNRGQVTGSYVDGNFTGHAFVYDRGVYTLLDGPPDTIGINGYDLNDKGQVVGQYLDSNGNQPGFLYDRGTY